MVVANKKEFGWLILLETLHFTFDIFVWQCTGNPNKKWSGEGAVKNVVNHTSLVVCVWSHVSFIFSWH